MIVKFGAKRKIYFHDFIIIFLTFLELPAAAHYTIELWPTLVFRL